ncbi:MAG: phosphoribosylglycinamide formyltransferase [Ectothiorhodospiraceae bacterium]|jgi:phosphoribosylglycinamide formyltransferase-1
MSTVRLPVVVLISGSGTNLQTFIDQQNDGRLPIDIRAVISNRGDAYGLVRARAAGLETVVLPHREYPDRRAYDAALAETIDRFAPQLVILAGFMRILTPEFVTHYTGRLINVHPSLLPDYRGLHTHERVLEAGESEHGCSVHYVVPELDAGPVIAQARIAVDSGDTPETLKQRVQEQEYRIYPLAVRWIAEGRVAMRDGVVWLDGAPCATAPVVRTDDE